jgi:hypothetical protein
MSQQLYYLYRQSSGMWWRANEAGYTSDIGEAGQYSEDDARRICAKSDSTSAYRIEDMDASGPKPGVKAAMLPKWAKQGPAIQPKIITAWAICKDPVDPYKPPEASRLYLSGVCNGKPITTSYVQDIVAPRTYRTRTGSFYRLEGDPDPEYVAFCKKNGIALDLADPIKFKEAA